MLALKYKQTIKILFFLLVFVSPFFYPSNIFAQTKQNTQNKNGGIFQELYCIFNWKRDFSCIDYRLSSLSQNEDALEEFISLKSTTDNSGITALQVQMIKGDKGEKGDNGDAGQDGRDGTNGADGAQGPMGEKGDKGDQGISGNGGAKGDKGDKGEKKDAGSGTSYSAGSGIFISGSTLATTLGTTIENSEIADATITLAKLAASSCTDGQIPVYNSTSEVWECGNDAGGTSYTAGSGLSLAGSSFALDLSNANTWQGIQTFGNGLIVGGDTITDLTGTGLSVSSGTLSTTLGNSIESAEITNGTIVAVDIADGTLTLAKIGQNSCASERL